MDNWMDDLISLSVNFELHGLTPGEGMRDDMDHGS